VSLHYTPLSEREVGRGEVTWGKKYEKRRVNEENAKRGKGRIKRK
jgi:hypothetical protein